MNNVQLIRKALKRGFKILWDDIETSPPLVYTYPLRDVTIPHDNIVIDKQITSIGYMFEGEKKPTTLEWDFKSPIKIYPDRIEGGGDDTRMLKAYSEVMQEADLIIAQNGDSFDRKEINWRMNDLRLKPLENKVLTLDTLKLSRKVFRPSSQKLDYRSARYGLGGKIHQTMKDCMDVARGDLHAQAERVRYNGKDVRDLRAIFWRELPFYDLPKSIVRMLLLYIAEERPFCQKCAASRQAKFKVIRIRKNKKMHYKCQTCEFVWKIK